jgi:hypothetical protein
LTAILVTSIAVGFTKRKCANAAHPYVAQLCRVLHYRVKRLKSPIAYLSPKSVDKCGDNLLHCRENVMITRATCLMSKK